MKQEARGWKLFSLPQMDVSACLVGILFTTQMKNTGSYSRVSNQTTAKLLLRKETVQLALVYKLLVEILMKESSFDEMKFVGLHFH